MHALIARIGAILALGGLAAAFALGCQPTPLKPVPAAPEPQNALEDFNVDNVWAHLQALTEIGPRASGTDGAARARSYIRDQLDELDLEVDELSFKMSFEDEHPTLEMVNLIATVPGASDDLFVLATPYDTRYFESFRFVGANAGGSGAALLLELARVVSRFPLPYTTTFAFLEGEAPLGRGPEEDHATAWAGSTALARTWQQAGLAPHIRLLVYLDRVGDADLRVARDLFSHRSFRETFWSSAAELGYTEAFEPGRAYESPRAGHQAFLEAGVRRVIAVVDPSFGGEEPPGVYADTEDDTIERCSPQSLEAVGRVSLVSLETIGRRLAKIDRFSDAPLRELPAEAKTAAPATEPVPEPPGAAEPAPVPAADAQPADDATSAIPTPEPATPGEAAAPR